jgi:putative ABC transport system substrate-binding protein
MQFVRLKRREFITVVAAAAAVCPQVARAQQRIPVIGYLSGGTAAGDLAFATAFRKGLDEGGYVEGRNVEILFRHAERQFDRLPSLASDLVDRRVAVIVASGSAPALAARAGTATIPIVFESVYDPVAMGLVASLSRPGGNITGATALAAAFFAKGVELMHELTPQSRVLAILANPWNPTNAAETKDAESTAQALGLRLINLKASHPGDRTGFCNPCPRATWRSPCHP